MIVKNNTNNTFLSGIQSQKYNFLNFVHHGGITSFRMCKSKLSKTQILSSNICCILWHFMKETRCTNISLGLMFGFVHYKIQFFSVHILWEVDFKASSSLKHWTFECECVTFVQEVRLVVTICNMFMLTY